MELAQVLGLCQRNAAGREAQGFAANDQVLVEHARDAGPVDLGMHCPGWQQNLLLDPEMALPVVSPELEKGPRRLFGIAGLAQLLRGQEGAKMLARKGAKSLCSFHNRTVAPGSSR